MDSLKVMSNWYSQMMYLYEIVFTSLRDRETAFMLPKHMRSDEFQNAFRCFKVFSPKGLNYTLKRTIDFQQKSIVLNTYYSLARYEAGIPDFGGVLQFRKKEIDEWNENHYKFIKAYDLLIDIDSPSHRVQDMKMAKLSCARIVLFLDSYNIPYYLRFSGMGYHIVIPHTVFAHKGWSFDPNIEDTEGTVYFKYNKIIKYFHTNISELVDTDIHDSRRITKAPYTLVFYKDTVWVCWPFNTRKEFQNHNFDDYRVLNEYLDFRGKHNQDCFKRGQRLFNDDTSNLDDINSFIAEVLKNGDEKKRKISKTKRHL